MSRWRRPQALLLLLACLLLAASLGAPRLNLTLPVYRCVLVFDISQSMNVTDVGRGDARQTRLEFAKQRALEALKSLPCFCTTRRLNWRSSSPSTQCVRSCWGQIRCAWPKMPRGSRPCSLKALT